MGSIRKGWPKLSRYSKDYQRQFERAVKQIVLETATILQNEVKSRMPRDTGELADSVTMRIEDGGLSAVVHIGAEHAIWVNYGTGIHAEGPGGSRAKKIPWTYFSPKLNRWVTTSGMRPQEFWEPSTEIAARYFVREMNKLTS